MIRSIRAFALLASAVAVAASCSSSSSPTAPLTPSEMAGNYTLLTFSQGGTNVPGTTGAMTLTTTRYAVTLNIPPSTTQIDSGTYTISGNSFSQTSDVNHLTFTGSASMSNNVLSVTVTTPGGVVANTWQKN